MYWLWLHPPPPTPGHWLSPLFTSHTFCLQMQLLTPTVRRPVWRYHMGGVKVNGLRNTQPLWPDWGCGLSTRTQFWIHLIQTKPLAAATNHNSREKRPRNGRCWNNSGWMEEMALKTGVKHNGQDRTSFIHSGQSGIDDDIIHRCGMSLTNLSIWKSRQSGCDTATFFCARSRDLCHVDKTVVQPGLDSRKTYIYTHGTWLLGTSDSYRHILQSW